jgi:nitroreductase
VARHFAEAPLLLIGYGRNRDGSGVHPALWSAMLAARAEGIGATLTGVMQTFVADEVSEILGVPNDGGWYLHGVVPMGYPTGRWGSRALDAGPRGCRPHGWDGDLGFTVPKHLWPGDRTPSSV